MIDFHLVNRADAGVADLTVTVTDPSGMSVPFDVESTPTGEKVTYVPLEPGTYKIHVTIGCTDVPGIKKLLETSDLKLEILD